MSSILALTRDGILCSRAVYVAAALGIPDRLKDGPRTAEELADLVHVHAPSLRRVLRFLAGRGLFHEDARGRFRLTPLGDTLRSDRADSTRPLALFWNEDYRWRAYGDVLHAVATGQTAVEHLYGAPMFEFLSAHPEHARGFDAAMTAVSTHAIPAVLDAYDFRRIRVLVDVGGGQGSLLAGILRAHPGMRGVLVDLPPVAARARERFEGSPLGDRLTVTGGDMFESVPSGGDAYVLRKVLHDWDDGRASQILRTCRRAMVKGARLLLVEGIVPPRNVPSPVRTLDLGMLLMTGGRERTAAEFRGLLHAAGFRLVRIVPTRAGDSVIEARAA